MILLKLFYATLLEVTIKYNRLEVNTYIEVNGKGDILIHTGLPALEEAINEFFKNRKEAIISGVFKHQIIKIIDGIKGKLLVLGRHRDDIKTVEMKTWESQMLKSYSRGSKKMYEALKALLYLENEIKNEYEKLQWAEQILAKINDLAANV